MSPQNYEKFKRVLAFGGAIFIWFISVNFSRIGFNFNVQEDNVMGVGLALVITVLQLVWNSKARSGNWTLYMIGLLAYVYGMFTNIAGLMENRGIALTWEALNQVPFTSFFLTIFGIMLEWAPEPLFIYGLTGGLFGADGLKNLFGDGEQVLNHAKQNFNNQKGGKHPNQQTGFPVGNQYPQSGQRGGQNNPRGGGGQNTMYSRMNDGQNPPDHGWGQNNNP